MLFFWKGIQEQLTGEVGMTFVLKNTLAKMLEEFPAGDNGHLISKFTWLMEIT